MPGLVNAHTHAAMTLLRGLADDLPLMSWLNDHIWPAERDHVGPGFVHDGTALAIAEMLRGGTTCFNDMYFFPDVAARAASQAGIRAVVGMIFIDVPTAWAQDADEYIDKGLAVHDDYREDPLITTTFAPHAPYTVGEDNLARLRTLADELGVPVHIHLHETADEIQQSLAATGERPLRRLDRLGLVTPGLVAVHMTQLEADEIGRLAGDRRQRRPLPRVQPQAGQRPGTGGGDGDGGGKPGPRHRRAGEQQ
ncbi:MAG: amidohydrolase family protein [Arhodomonas sp.]|nr:amidohydrolase family protein [Arhodomonas sp.]